MRKNQFARSTSAFLLILALFTVAVAPAFAQAAAGKTQIGTSIVAPEYAAQLAKFEERFEKRRAELGIPGASVVIVKDDQIIYLKGLGYKDFEKKIAVTPDTQFAIGSATKAFTALSVLMSQDEGKMNLDDHPKKYLSYFKINDPETDAKITVRDLLSHSSGLNRTDIAMVSGKLNREELIRVAGEAKPVAKLREKFGYQNIMFAAAGEAVAKVNKTTWEKYVTERIFKPLGMTNSNLTVKEMQKAKDYSFGYTYNPDSKETRQVPTRDILEVAPAGSINSSARDMANWVRFMLNGGQANGKRLVSEAAFAEFIKPQMKITPNGRVNYGLGWFLQDWNGMKVVQHGGNIDGFNALVGLMPEKKIGFAILTNVSGSPLPNEMMGAIWENLVGKPNTENTAAAVTARPEAEVGKYRLEGAFDIEVLMKDGKLTAIAPNQPNYILENVSGRKYKLTGAPDGFFITFKDNEAYLEQPQGNYTLPRVKADGTIEAKPVSTNAKELVGKYESEANKGAFVDIVERDGKVFLEISGQPPYELRDKAKDAFALHPLPDSFTLKVRRDTSGKVSGVASAQPEGEFGFKRVEAKTETASNAPKMTVDELMPKVIEELGGEANWRKFNSRVMKVEFDFVHQGVKGTGTAYAKAPNMSASEVVFTALGKPIGTAFEYFDGKEGAEDTSFTPSDRLTGKQLEDARLNADFYGLANWKTNYKKAEMKTNAKVGDEEAFVVVFEPEKGNKDTIYFSTKTFLPLKLESFNSLPTMGVDMPYSETYSDYRNVDGIMLPFKTINSTSSNGDLVTTVKEVKHNTAIDNKVFQFREL
jgi:CubicO group peptidase (beta-lactamase class C family)